jgi:E3 ubiquitin-protein ligase CCNP1IP1
MKDQFLTQASHIFCLPCANGMNLPNAELAYRTCPACNARLNNRDDCALTTMNPSEDYKTSILSGFGPSVIMECAARALAFYSYQATQEMYGAPECSDLMANLYRTYQTFLHSSLSSKYNQKSNQLETYAVQATSEIQRLQELLEGSNHMSRISTNS